MYSTLDMFIDLYAWIIINYSIIFQYNAEQHNTCIQPHFCSQYECQNVYLVIALARPYATNVQQQDFLAKSASGSVVLPLLVTIGWSQSLLRTGIPK